MTKRGETKFLVYLALASGLILIGISLLYGHETLGLTELLAGLAITAASLWSLRRIRRRTRRAKT
jgi:NADH:ubiquinone oxidoreductase subunit 2 (subunit N)